MGLRRKTEALISRHTGGLEARISKLETVQEPTVKALEMMTDVDTVMTENIANLTTALSKIVRMNKDMLDRIEKLEAAKGLEQ